MPPSIIKPKEHPHTSGVRGAEPREGREFFNVINVCYMPTSIIISKEEVGSPPPGGGPPSEEESIYLYNLKNTNN